MAYPEYGYQDLALIRRARAFSCYAMGWAGKLKAEVQTIAEQDR